jgi:potassium-transporting ATPase KdpC subunit
MTMKYARPAILLTLLFVVVTGLLFPLAIWAIGRVAFPEQAAGSLIRDGNGNVIGSSLIGQAFVKPEYFHPRPSAAGAGYDAANSSGTNLGPTSDKLINGVKDDAATTAVDESFLGFKTLAQFYREENGLPEDAVIPADAVTRSGSGLDPHISPANAALQVARVAKARSLSADRVRGFVAEYTERRSLGIFGEPRVNVLLLNRALDIYTNRR